MSGDASLHYAVIRFDRRVPDAFCCPLEFQTGPMQAVIFDSVGEPESVLQVRNIDVPQPQAGEVRV